ncbi:MAG TPA: T9SS type A sorting domain-containing protein [Cyclobacteriaceae bacterium]|nr:T9SS type A sorting domain-containing protein [Cyclobacteriaceae bacterium]
MRLCRLICVFVLGWSSCFAQQSIEFIDRQDAYSGSVNETLAIPLRIKNTSDKAQFYIIRKVYSDMGTSQKGYFCIGKDCLDHGMDEFSKRLEPGETLEGLAYTLETGMLISQNSFKFEVFPRGNPSAAVEHNVSVSIEEKRGKTLVFQSKDITIHDVYPNPVSDLAFIDYTIHNEAVKAKVVIHNILGRTMNETELPTFETKIKIPAEDLATGIYFYTLYLDNNGVLTRKMIVRK